MSLINQSLQDYLAVLASKSHVPGGGAAAAVTGAQAAALLAMVGNLTVGKKKFLSVEAEVKSLINKLNLNREALLELVQRDADGFHQVMLAYQAPDTHDLQQALIAAAQPPLEMMAQIAQLKPIAKRLETIGNPNLLSDVNVAHHLIVAGLLCAKENVVVNANALTDEQKKSQLLDQAESYQN